MRKLIIPIVSMRSHETNRYSLLKDGNLQLHIARARYGDIIMVPRNSVDLEELMDRFQHIQFVPLQDWPLNAYETRKRFWQMHDIEEKIRGKKISHIVTDITNCPVESVPVIYNFNITADPKNPRPYIDEFLESDVESANKSLRTFVLNDIQKENLVKAGVDENKIVVSQKVLSPSMYFQYFRRIILISGTGHHKEDRVGYSPRLMGRQSLSGQLMELPKKMWRKLLILGRKLQR